MRAQSAARVLLAAEPYTVFLDESGDHSLAKIDPQYPLFGLAGVLMENGAHSACSSALSSWKAKFFGANVCLHMQEITRNLGHFGVLTDALKRAKFYSELQSHLDQHVFMLVCSVILKDKHLQQYQGAAHNPYYLTLEFLVERFYFEMRDRRSKAGFVAESRQAHLDRALQAQYAALLANGTPFVKGSELRRYLAPKIQFQGKHPDAIGLQIADLAAGPTCRKIGNMKKAQSVNFAHRFRRSPGGAIEGWGLKVFP
jgi:hypothetical protein